MRRRTIIGLVVGFSLLGAGLIKSDTFAAVDQSNILKKWVFTEYIQCAENGINHVISSQETSNNNNDYVRDYVFSKSQSLKLPSYNYLGVKSDVNINCKEMFLGSDKASVKGALSYSSMDASSAKWSDGSSKVYDFLVTGLGYETNHRGTKTIHIKVDRTNPKADDNQQMSLRTISYNDNTGKFSLGAEGSSVPITVKLVDNTKLKLIFNAKDQLCDSDAVSEINIDLLQGNFDGSVERIRKETDGRYWSTCLDSVSGWVGDKFNYTYSFAGVATGNSSYYTYENTDDSLNRALKHLAGYNNPQEVFWSPSERYTIYMYYLQRAFDNSIACGEDLSSSSTYKKVRLKDENGVFNDQCYVNTNGKNPDDMIVYIQSEKLFDNRWTVDIPAIRESNLGEVIKWLNNVPESELADVAALGEVNNGVEPLDSDNEEDICFANSGALGWIICPIIEAMHGVGKTMWTQIEEYHLKIPAQKVFESGGGVEQGWNIVRNIANVVFIIILLFVIFSQLTGVGIDNYGIKKILPKLIVIAILVNLSYLICGIVVDLSNILGMGLNNLLSSAGGPLGEGASGGAQVTSWALTTVLAGGGFYLFNYLQAGSVSGAFVGMGLAVLGIFIIIVVAMLTLYLILIIREAGIVLAVVIAPVAIVCYALPNTEKLAKKWFDVLKALLVVYPICGAMVGGGQLAGSILASIGNSGMSVAAMIVQVLPFFLVPVILKNSLSLLGNIGARVSSFGGKIGRRGSSGARGAIRNSERYKALANEGQRQKQMRFNDRNLHRLENKERRAKLRGRELSEGDKRQYARSAEALDRAKRENWAANTILAEREFKDNTEGDLQKAWNDAFDAGDEDRLDALTNVIMSRYGSGGAKFIGSALSGKDIMNNQRAQASMSRLRDNLQHNSTFNQQMRAKASDAYEMINNGGRDSNGQFANLRYFTETNHISTDVSSWATQSAETLQRALNAGKLTAEDAKEILNSTDPAIQSGIQTDRSKRDVLQAAVYFDDHPPATVGPNISTGVAAKNYRDEQKEIANAVEQRKQQVADNVAEIADGLRIANERTAQMDRQAEQLEQVNRELKDRNRELENRRMNEEFMNQQHGL